MIAKRTISYWVAVCDDCHHEGIQVRLSAGQTRQQRRRAFLGAVGAGGEHLVPASDGAWLCNTCREGRDRLSRL